jgi:selenocysteine lyase/cysteine desulfurase
MTPQPTWVDGRVDALLAALHDLGMSASRAAATELIHERVQWVSSQMGISPTAARRYLTDDALADLARTMVLSVADETPGADVTESARTAAVPLPILGRCIAGLAEAIQIRLRELDDIDHLRTTVAQLAQALSAIGQVTSDHTPDPAGRAAAVVILMPPGLVNRAARYLEAAAILVHQGVLPEDFSTTHAGQLAATFMQDAASLRYYADERPDE